MQQWPGGLWSGFDGVCSKFCHAIFLNNFVTKIDRAGTVPEFIKNEKTI